ncbi:hypothetical protein N1851_031595 [Merluccius polli]|uniref:Uncharacterized protein n=1 Tax=Merluccius polli TaxID=89951 RepID=A0AA47NP32_MERPO|nr:hypothetical protein N1851_031595 [Merluccius polli]
MSPGRRATHGSSSASPRTRPGIRPGQGFVPQQAAEPDTLIVGVSAIRDIRDPPSTASTHYDFTDEMKKQEVVATCICVYDAQPTLFTTPGTCAPPTCRQAAPPQAIKWRNRVPHTNGSIDSSPEYY